MATSLSDAPASVTPRSSGRAALHLLTTLIAVAAMGVAAWRFVAAPSLESASVQGGVAFLVGALALAVTRGQTPARDATPSIVRAEAAQSHPSFARYLPVGFGAGALALVAAAGDDRFAGVAQALGAHGQFVLWLGGIALVAWGLSGAPRPHWPALPRRETALLLAILVVALLLRVYRLDLLRLLVDEWHFTNGARYFWNNPTPQLLRPIGTLDPFPRVITYLVADTVALFGRTFAAVRVVPALAGVATVGAAYLLARELFDRRIALSAAALTATFPPLIHFSRMGTISVIDPLFGTLTLAFLARALRTGQRGDYVLAGVLLGLTQYFHEAGRLLLPPLVALWLIILLLTRTQARHIPGTIYGFRIRWPFSWRGLAVGLLAALLVVAPLIYVQRTQPERFKTRLQYAALTQEYWRALLLTSDLRPQLERIRESSSVFVRTPDTTIYYAGPTPLILPPLVPLFLLGAAAVLTGRRRTGAGLLALWLAAAIVGNSLLVTPTASVHFLVAMPAAVLLIAAGLNAVVTRIAPRRSTAMLALVVAVIGVGQAAYYFGPHLNTFQLLMASRHLTDTHDVLLRAAALPPQTEAHLIIGPTDAMPLDQLYAQDVLDYLADGRRIDLKPAQDINDPYLLTLDRATTQAFFVKPSQDDAIGQIRRAFPSIGQPEQTPYALVGETYLLFRYDPPGTAP